MANTYFTIVTDSGTKKMFEAFNEEKKVSIIDFAVGDGGGAAYEPTHGMEALKNEVWRGSVSSCYVSGESENLLIIEAVIPSNVGGFTIREMGVFDTDGTLIAICNTPDTQKVKVSDGVVHELALSMEIALSNMDNVELIIDPTVVTATKKDIENLNKQLLENTLELRQQLLDKVDKETGKGLSSNDFTADDKEKLDNGLVTSVNGQKGDVSITIPPFNVAVPLKKYNSPSEEIIINNSTNNHARFDYPHIYGNYSFVCISIDYNSSYSYSIIVCVDVLNNGSDCRFELNTTSEYDYEKLTVLVRGRIDPDSINRSYLEVEPIGKDGESVYVTNITLIKG